MAEKPTPLGFTIGVALVLHNNQTGLQDFNPHLYIPYTAIALQNEAGVLKTTEEAIDRLIWESGSAPPRGKEFDPQWRQDMIDVLTATRTKFEHEIELRLKAISKEQKP